MREELKGKDSLNDNKTGFSVSQTIKQNILSVLLLIKPKTAYESKRFGLFNSNGNQIRGIEFFKGSKQKGKFQTVGNKDVQLTILKKGSIKTNSGNSFNGRYDKYGRLLEGTRKIGNTVETGKFDPESGKLIENNKIS